MSKPRTKTAARIDNINRYINKVGAFFGVNSPEYEKITNGLANAGLVTYENKKGFINVSNSKVNRMKHQKIRAIDRRKPSFARQKRRYYKERAEIFPGLSIPDLDNIGVNDVEIDVDFGETADFDPVHGKGTDGKPLDFDTWYKEWRNTWTMEEQYEIRQLADDLGVPFDHELWYQDYSYREEILTELYTAYEQGINAELAQHQNANGNSIDDETGEEIVFDNDWFNQFTDIEW